METLARAANRGSIATDAAYDIDNSLKLESDNTEYLNKTFSSVGNRKIWTFSCWVKRTELGSTPRDSLFSAYVDNNNRLRFNFYNDNIEIFGYTSGTNINITTNAVFRDTSAWYHVVWSCDTTQATADNRIKVYVNSEQVTSFSTATYPTQNSEPLINNNVAHFIGQRGDSQAYTNGYIAEAHFVDGQQLEPTDFGEFDSDTGIWKPKAYTGSYGTNGFYLDFESSGSLGADSSGNGNNFTLNNITSADQALDTPTNNFCTLNPLIVYGYPTTISEGAVKGVDNSVGFGGAAGTVAVNKGKWYWEFKSSASTTIMGIQDIEADTRIADNAHEISYTMGVYLLGQYNYAADPTGRNDGSTSGLGFDADRRYAVALNLDDDEITYYQLGSSAGTFSLDGLAGLYVRPFASCAGTLQWNFGGYTTMGSYSNTDDNGYGNFEYAPPSGYYALCSKNLAEFG